MKLQIECPKCGIVRNVSSQVDSKIAKGTFIQFSCGHSKFISTELAKSVERDSQFTKLYPFQREGVDFIEKSNYRCLIGDDMGLGKTVQILVAIRYSKFKRVLYVVKSAVKYQWQEQIGFWNKKDGDMYSHISQVIEAGYNNILPIAPHVIISMDMLEKLKDKIIEWNPELIVVDESQNFKAQDSQRKNALVEIIREIQCRHVVCLSGTPIMNKASEFYTTLNIIAPQHWPSRRSFEWHWCASNRNGNGFGGLLPYKREEFFSRTKPYIIRREKREVLTDLPKFTRNYEWVRIEDEALRKAYNGQLKSLERTLKTIDDLKQSAFQSNATILGYLEKLRQIAALSKIPWIVEYVEAFLTVEETEKIIIGIDHHVVSDTLMKALKQWKPIKIDGTDTAQKKHEKKDIFINDPSRRIAIISIRAGGEGLDGLQHVCSNMLTVERQWNLTRELQFEARIDRHGQTKPVQNTLLLAKGTVDEYFTLKVIEKQGYVLSATKQGDVESEIENMASNLNYRELAEECINHRV